MKFGIIVPTTTDKADKFNKTNGITFWADIVAKERSRVIDPFQISENDESLHVGSKLIPYHFVFGVTFDLTRKSRLVAGSNRNKDVAAHSTYASVVSRDSVRVLLILAALNSLDILSGDISNAYLNAPCEKKVHVIADTTFWVRKITANEHS